MKKYLGLRVAQSRPDDGGVTERCDLDIPARQRNLRIGVAKELDVFDLVLLPELTAHGEVGGIVHLRDVAKLDNVLPEARNGRGRQGDRHQTPADMLQPASHDALR